MSITGIGTDLVKIDRIQRLIHRYGERFTGKIFTLNEIAYCSKRAAPEVHFAGRFAAKEAIAKAAYQTGWMQVILWRDIEVSSDDYGRPSVQLLTKIPGVCHVSISHDGEYALAFAIWETDHA